MSALRRASSTTGVTRSSSSRLKAMLRSVRSWMRWRRNRTTQADPLAQLELMVRQAELQLELALLTVQQLQAEKERLVLTLDVRLLEEKVHPPQELMQQLGQDPWTEPPPAPPEPDPWTEPPAQEPTAFEQISQLIGLSPPQISSLPSDS